MKRTVTADGLPAINLVSGECRQGTVAVQLALLPVWPCRWDSRVLRRIGKFHCKCWMMVAVAGTRLTFTGSGCAGQPVGILARPAVHKNTAVGDQVMFVTPARRWGRGSGYVSGAQGPQRGRMASDKKFSSWPRRSMQQFHVSEAQSSFFRPILFH